jgi:hypothetical protein
MDLNQDGGEPNKVSFISHVFSTTEEGKAEIMNAAQYGLMGIIPVVLLNKLVQKFIPDADPDKNSLEIIVEVLIQTIIMLSGIVFIHRMITYIPSYSGFKYEMLNITNVILAFLIIVLSLQTKIGLKMNILLDRVMEMYNGPSAESMENMKKKGKTHSGHSPSQADNLDDSQVQGGVFPPAPVPTVRQPQTEPFANTGMQAPAMQESFGPMAANAALGNAFGAF